MPCRYEKMTCPCGNEAASSNTKKVVTTGLTKKTVSSFYLRSFRNLKGGFTNQEVMWRRGVR